MKQQQLSHKAHQAIASFALMLAGSITIGLSTEAYRGKPASPLGVFAGIGMIAASMGFDRRHRLSGDDYLDGLKLALDAAIDSVSALGHNNRTVIRQAIPINCLPERYRSLVSVLAEKLLHEDWVREFVKRSKLVVGVTRSGKTTYLLYEVAVFYQDYPDGHLTICDLNYKKPDADGNVNDWFRLPRDRFIRVEYEEIFESIQTEWDELQRRRKLCMESTGQVKLQRRKLLVDETIGVINEAKGRDKLKSTGAPKDLPQLQRWICDLLYQGLGYQMECTFGLHNLAVGETGFNLAMQEQLNVLILGASAINVDNAARLPGVRDSAGLVEEVKRIRKLSGCQYAAIAKIGSEEPCIKVVPHLDISQFELQVPESPQSAIEQWWQQVFDEQAQKWLFDLACRFVKGEIKSPLKGEICPRFGCETRLSDPKYSLVKQAWEDAQTKAKGETP